MTTPSGTATSTSHFSVWATPPAPTITSFSLTSGSPGTSVTITGKNFTGATMVKFNGTSASLTVVSDTQITTTVPNGATTGRISVTNSKGTATSADPFTIRHLRRVTLALSRSLRASGTVRMLDGTAASANTVAVRIQRLVSGSWVTVGTTTTNGSGGYSVRVSNRVAEYRARAPRSRLSNDDVCARATSARDFNS